MSSAEEIRLKRLARLGGASSSPTPETDKREDKKDKEEEKEDKKETKPAESSTSSVTKPTAKPVSKLPVKPKIKIVPKVATSTTTTRPPTAPAPAASLSVSYDQYVQDAIESILRITVRESPRCVQLSSVKQELQSENKSVQLSADNVEDALFSHLTGSKTVFNYLMESFLRAKKDLAVLNKAGPEAVDVEPKKELVKTILQMTVRYGLLYVSVPDMYEQAEGIIEVLRLSQNGSLSWEFMDEIFTSAQADGEIGSVAGKILQDVNGLILSANQDASQSATASLYFVAHLFSNKTFAAAVPQIEGFVESGTNDDKPADIEKNPVGLGPVFAISPLHGSTALTFFPIGTPPQMMDPRGNAANGVRAESRIVQDQLFQIVDKIVRASPQARDSILQYFGRVLKCNHRRRATRLQEGTTSSDGFLLNIFFVLLKLADPFVDNACSKIDKIDIDYYSRTTNAVIDISEETKIHADSTEAAEYYENAAKKDVTPNFISHVFFLTAGYLYYGFGGAQQQVTRLKEHHDQVRDYLENSRVQYANVPEAQRGAVNMQLQKVEKMVGSLAAQRAAILAVISEQDVCVQVLQFAIFQMHYLIRVLDPSHVYPRGGEVTLPLYTGENTGPIGYLPEYLIEGPVGIVNVICRHNTILAMLSPLVDVSALVTFGVVFLRHSDVIKNPHQKSKIVEMLFCGTQPIYNQNDGFLVSTFNSQKLALESLMHSLMNIYIEFEQTGAHTQFYDKFNIRYYVSQIIESIWNNVNYQKRLEKESHDNIDFFVRFVALLLNDVTYLMDESVSSLTEIRQIEAELATMSEEEKKSTHAQELEKKFKTAERNIKGWMPLTNKNMKLLDLFTQAVPRSFVSPEIVDRLAAMMNHNLKALVGPRCRDLKVKNMLKYGFDPKDLLVKLSKAYYNLHKQDAFIQAVARDGRSFDPANFTRAIELISRFNLMPREHLDQIVALRNKAEEVAAQDEEDEQDLGDIPDEYLDPLMYTLMTNPVILPSSKINIDLATIKSHLLSDPKDPFNRAPLKLEDVLPNEELKVEIEAWVKEKRSAAKKKDADGDVDMS
ncbi:E4 ubiquitin-protein ligase UFD2 [Yarrowia sp. C11]|nr:E4 ubiquitin-protein ligase UFD2 [Yarrowia sp. E02]KAG5369433.1 E4 ubiquitin-protein ligase UFD2 [Yarrowia sp. C11]